MVLLLTVRSSVKVLRHQVILQPRQKVETLLAVGANEPARHVCRVLDLRVRARGFVRYSSVRPQLRLRLELHRTRRVRALVGKVVLVHLLVFQKVQ